MHLIAAVENTIAPIGRGYTLLLKKSSAQGYGGTVSLHRGPPFKRSTSQSHEAQFYVLKSLRIYRILSA